MMSRPGLTILWALVLAILCHAGPINRQTGGHNTLRLDIRNQSYTEQNVCVNDDVLYQPGDLMPAPTPCSRCVCSPPGSLCTPVACEKRPGCKALQRPNQCCPEYQCECERNGRLYANGERLDNADNPCQACYCQGGEVVCTTVECYRRDDCEPQFVPGRCCPKYDHCPPLVMDDSRYGDRPHHTRATFQPSSGLEGEADVDPAEDDQALGASNVQERVHLPQEAVVATATTTPAPTTVAAPASDTVVPAATDAFAATVTDVPATTPPPPQDSPRDAAIKIDVPAVPWTETPEPTPAVATTQPTQTGEEGSGATEDEMLDKKGEEAVIGVIERVGEPVRLDESIAENTEETATAATTSEVDSAKEDATEAQTEQEPITRLFMLSKEAELDPTTVSTEYTDIPDEMSTTPEATSLAKETTVVAQGVDLSTEALLEVTATTKESPVAPEAATDSSPEFKDFDEWSGSKSSEFLRDSASTGSSGGSSSGSETHSKPAGSTSDESTSHFLATNINAETVKLSSDSSSVPHSEGSSTDSTESAESSEEAATTETTSTESENAAKTSENKESLPGTKPDESHKEENPILDKTDSQESNEKAKEEEKTETQKNGKEKVQPDIVLDTEATDENGPPILLIGDDLANHQMDIVVATSSTEEAETETPGVDGKPELRLDQQESTDLPTDATDITTDGATDEPAVTTEQPQADAKGEGEAAVAQKMGVEPNVFDETRTEEPASATDAPVTDAPQEALDESVAGSGETKDAASSTEKLEAATAADDVMMSDDPLPGQAASAETAARDENVDDILGKTEDKKKESDDETQTEDGAQSATVLTTLSDEAATEDPVNIRMGDLKTESPERESTTNTVKEEKITTLEPKYETTTLAEGDKEGEEKEETKKEEKQGTIDENVTERRADVTENENKAAEDQATTIAIEENPTTTESSNTERTNVQNKVVDGLGDGADNPNQDKTEIVREVADVRSQIAENDEKVNSDKESKNQSPEVPPKDSTTTIAADTTYVPTTQLPVTDKVSNTNIAADDIMLGDQAQSFVPATKLQSTEAKEQKKEEEKELKKEEKTEQKAVSDNTEKIQTAEQEETTEIKDRIDVDEASDSTPKPEPDVQTESIQTTVVEQNTESVQKPESDIPEGQNTETEKTPESEQKSDVNSQQQEPEEQSSQILVDSAKISEKDEVIVKSGDVHDVSSDELSTPPPDTTSSDAKIQEEAVTSPPAKSADPEEVSLTDSTTAATTAAPVDEQHVEPADSGVKINPEVLGLKPPATVSSSQSNASEATTFEPDPTTLSPEWLKSDNDTKEDSANGHKDQEQKEGVAGTEAEPQVSPIGDVEGGEQQRVERRVDETDKKDLFLLEDFFTKLYRHQIATDANKEH